MKNFRKFLAVFLSIAMVMCSSLPSLASETETTVGASEEIVETSEDSVGDDILSSHDEETESTEETVGAKLGEPAEEADESVGASSTSPEEETESSETVGDDILSSHDEETESTVASEPDEDVGASTASPEEETESTDETTLEETTLKETTTEDTTESLKELKATKSDLISKEELLGGYVSTPWYPEWMFWKVEGDTIHFSSTDLGGYTIIEKDNASYALCYEGLADKSTIKTAVFDNEIYAPSCLEFFKDFSNLSEIQYLSRLKTNSVTEMSMMFYCCSSLTGLDLSGFNTSKVTSFTNMFYNCSSLKEILVSDSFVTTNATHHNNMFAGCIDLVGGSGTTYDDTHTNKEYARIDGGTAAPGYFTRAPWMYWWLTDEDGDSTKETIHFSSTDPGGVGAKPISGTGAISYDGLNSRERSNIRKAVFEDEIEAETCEKLFSEFYKLDNIVNIDNLKTSKVTNMSRVFNGCNKLDYLDVTKFNTENVTNMASMFAGCNKLDSLDLSNFKTSKVTNMYGMFSGCSSLSGLDLSKFITDSVENMSNMFYGCSKLSELDLKSFKVNNVEDMGSMFSHCTELTKLDITSFTPNKVKYFSTFLYGCFKLNEIDLSGLDTSSAEYMENMFGDCYKLEILDLRNFSTEKVIAMDKMFSGCELLKKIIVSNKFNISNVTYSGEMFLHCFSLVGGAGTTYDRNKVDAEYARIDKPGTPGYFTDANWMYWWLTDGDKTIHYQSYDPGGVGAKPITGTGAISYDGLDWNVRKNITKAVFEDKIEAETCQDLFYGFALLETIEKIENLKTSKVTNMSCMFYNCNELTALDVTNFDTSSVTNMSSMFYRCSLLTELDFSKFTTDNVENMSYMFNSCESLTKLDLKSFKVNKVERMSGMFSECKELKKLDITSFTHNKAKSFSGFLHNCYNLSDIDLSGLDTSSAEDLSNMFYNCELLTELDLSSFKTKNVTNMSEMFYACESLTELDLSSFETENVIGMGKMFRDCFNLKKIIVSKQFVTTAVIDGGMGMFSGCKSLVGGAGTKYDDGYTSIKYAHIDGGTASPGFFSNSPWMYWYLSDSNKTIHYTYAKPASGDYGTVTRTDQVVYDNLTKSDITKAVLEEDINPATCEGFFESFTNLKSIEGLEKLRTVDVKNMKRMFFECSELEKLDLKHFNTSNVELMEQMFSGCNKLVTITVSDHLVTTSVTDDGVGMFENCTSLVGGNGTKFDASHTNKAYARVDKNNTPGYFTGTILKSISINTQPQNTVYNVGDTLDPSGLIINLHYSDNSTEVEEYNSQTEADFTFRPSLGTALALTDRIVTVTYDGKSTTFTIEVKQSGGGGVKPKPGGNTGGSSSGSSGGSGGGGPTIAEDVPGITYLNATSAILGVFASSSSNWSYDPVDNSWQLNSIDANGNVVRAINGLYALTHVRTHIVNGVPIEATVTSVYCLNANAKMVTGWVKTLDGKWFFFENKKNADERKMVTGWKQIQGAWYYFGEDGAMYINTTTPDGRRVGADGKLIQ